MKWSVYCHTNKINGKRYVGITSKKPEQRWQNGNGYKTQMFYRAIEKYGWEEFNHEILFTGLTESEAKQKEKQLIAKWKTNQSEFGYNLTDGGDGTVGYSHTAEAKDKMSQSHKGLKQSEETKEKHRKAILGIKRSTKTREKMSEYAKHRTESHKDKLAKANIGNQNRLGKKNTQEQTLKSAIKRAKKVECIETGKIYWGVYEAGRELNINGSLIGRVCRGERNQTHNLHFKFVE